MEGITLLALSAVPAFAGGLGEDVTKKVGVMVRLILTVSAAIAASLLVGATLDRLDVPGIDTMLQWPVFAIAFTAVAVGGMANAINIIDGYNGLAGGYALLVLGALAFVAVQVADPVVLTASLTMAGAVFGLLLWNYPKGKIFLGDGGAYLLGFWLGELSILLVARNPEVSPWFPMVLLIYPVFETCFSVYRRKLIRGSNPGHPDALHLHQLIYLRLSRISVGSRNPREITRRNSSVARYIWTGTAIFVLAALPVWRHTPVLVGITAIFCLAYLWLYIRLIRWRAPIWMITSTEPHVRIGARELP
jgi:UDP-GlcNAc:undecaprenyl-phosphate/decaprenyl-phosphate GlcNAc-1-phosphate transferase